MADNGEKLFDDFKDLLKLVHSNNLKYLDSEKYLTAVTRHESWFLYTAAASLAILEQLELLNKNIEKFINIKESGRKEKEAIKDKESTAYSEEPPTIQT